VSIGLLLALAACGGVEFVSDEPPANLPNAVLYFRPEESFWVVCSAARAGGQVCDFYNPDGQSIAFRCRYALERPLDREAMKRVWLSADRDLRFEQGATVPCEDRKPAPDLPMTGSQQLVPPQEGDQTQ